MLEMKVVEVEADKLIPLGKNLRKMTTDELDLLIRSIKDLGFVEPLHVVYYSDKDKYLVLNGNHRFKVGVEFFKFDKFPCVVLGHDWSEEDVMAEVIRLNNIHGEFDIVEVTKFVNSFLQKVIKEKGSLVDARRRLGLRVKDRFYKDFFKKEVGSIVQGEVNKESDSDSLVALEKYLSKLGSGVYVFQNSVVLVGKEFVAVVGEIVNSFEDLDNEALVSEVLKRLRGE